MNEQLLKASGTDVLSSRKKTLKNIMGEGGVSTPTPPMWGLKYNLTKYESTFI